MVESEAPLVDARRSPARGRRILLAWEMGDGLGHAARQLDIAVGLAAQGWAPVVAARNPTALAERYAVAGIGLIATPPHRSSFAGPGPFLAASFADVMGVCGYAEPAQLAAMVAAWDELLERQAPAVVIADYAPLLSLAAFGRVPLIGVGDGFVTPHGLPDGRFPTLRPGASPVWDPAALLEAAQDVQAARGLPQPSSLAQIIEGAGQVVAVQPELDVYAGTRPAPASGPWQVSPPPLRPPAEARFFAYLRMTHPLACKVLQALAQARMPGECYLHGATPQAVDAARRAGIEVHSKPPRLREALARTSMLIHHGGIGSLEEALMAGRPQLLLPRHLEQSLNAERATASFPGVFVLRGDATIEHLHERLPPLVRDAGPVRAAQRVAARLTARPDTAWSPLQRLLERTT